LLWRKLDADVLSQLEPPVEKIESLKSLIIREPGGSCYLPIEELGVVSFDVLTHVGRRSSDLFQRHDFRKCHVRSLLKISEN
jgi:hypothetical protein